MTNDFYQKIQRLLITPDPSTLSLKELKELHDCLPIDFRHTDQWYATWGNYPDPPNHVAKEWHKISDSLYAYCASVRVAFRRSRMRPMQALANVLYTKILKDEANPLLSLLQRRDKL